MKHNNDITAEELKEFSFYKNMEGREGILKKVNGRLISSLFSGKRPKYRKFLWIVSKDSENAPSNKPKVILDAEIRKADEDFYLEILMGKLNKNGSLGHGSIKIELDIESAEFFAEKLNILINDLKS